MQHAEYAVPYEGAKEMLSVDNVDNREFLRNLFLSMHNELSVQKKKTPQKNNEEKSLAMIYYPELRAFIWIISCLFFYSHSIVLGGFGEMSSTTRLTPRTSLIILVLILASTSSGMRDQSAVIASTLSTIRRAITLS